MVTIVWSSSSEAKSPENEEGGEGFLSGERLREVDGELSFGIFWGRGRSGFAPGRGIAFLFFLVIVAISGDKLECTQLEEGRLTRR